MFTRELNETNNCVCKYRIFPFIPHALICQELSDKNKCTCRGVRSLQKVGGHKNFQPKNFSNRIMLSLWYEKVGGHLTHFIQISAKSGWARASIRGFGKRFL